MWLLAFALLALVIGTDLRERGRQLSFASAHASTREIGQRANAVGAWISLIGGICLNVAVWHLF